MLRPLIVSGALIGIVAVGASAQTTSEPASKPKPPAEVAAMADRLAASLVKVEITAKYDKGEPPGGHRVFHLAGVHVAVRRRPRPG